MDTKGKYESIFQKTALSSDAFTTGYFVLCLLFFVPYAARYGGTLVIWFLPAACLLPFALMPLFYAFIHRADALLFGRYHFAMPVSAFLCALFFVMTCGAKQPSASSACLVFFGSLAFIISVMIYRYCAFSVRTRLLGESVVSATPIYELFCAFGGAVAVVAFIGFVRSDASGAFLNTAYFLGAIGVALALVQYLTSYYGIPKLGGKRIIPIKKAYATFFCGLERRTYLSSLFFQSALAATAALSIFYSLTFGFALDDVLIIACACVAAYAVTAYLCARAVNRRSLLLSVINFFAIAIAAITVTVCAAVQPKTGVVFALMVSVAIIVGVGGAVAVRQTKLRFLTIKQKVTSGTVFILSELAMLASASIASALSAAVVTALECTRSTTAFVYGFAAALALGAAAIALAGKRSVRAEQSYGVTDEPAT